jgi:uncharacterized repeat protein (TIGR02543 family)
MEPKKFLTTLFLIAVVLFAGCKKDKFVASTGVCPLVILTSPANAESGVLVNKIVTATFNEKMNPVTITKVGAFTVEASAKGSQLLSGTVAYVDSTASFTPSVALSPNKSYTGVIKATVKDLKGNYMQADYIWTFTTKALAAYTLTVTSLNGTVLKFPVQATYNAGTQVLLTATPNTGYSFSSWSGDTTATTNPLSVPMYTNRAITANYTLNTYTLNTTALNGIVSKNPLLPNYGYGSTVQITATPNTGYTFTSWTGDTTAITNPLTVTMKSNKNITANFAINTYTLNVNAVNGSVVKNPVQLTYNYGTLVDLTATANAGYVFSSWSGDASGILSPTSVLMNSNKNVTANFILLSAVCTPPVDLGLSGNYVILAESGISTTGVTTITGNMGISPSAATFITGFALILPPGGAFSTSTLVAGNVYAPGYANPTPATLTTSITNMSTAFTTANGIAPTVTELLAGNLSGQTLVAGVYKWSTGLLITNSLVLDGGGDPCASFVFQIAQNLTVANSTIITLQNGAQAKNIFWVVAGSGAVLGTNVDFSGNILSKTLISLNTGAKVLGRLMAQTAVTLNASTVILP